MPLVDEALASHEQIAADVVHSALKHQPTRLLRQNLAESGKSVYRVDFAHAAPVVLRTSPRSKTFAFTASNLAALTRLGLPVQTVLASGPTPEGGSFIILNWIPGRDLVDELAMISPAQMTRLAERVCDYQQRVASLPLGTGFGYAPIGRNGQLQSWTQMFGEPATPREDGTELGAMRVRLCALRRRLEPYFASVVPAPFLDDLTIKNVIVQAGELRGIIDVDFICYGDPLLTVGATLAAIVGAIPELSARFYGQELVRVCNPPSTARMALCFYAALWGLGSLKLLNPESDAQRIAALADATGEWLAQAESL